MIVSAFWFGDPIRVHAQSDALALAVLFDEQHVDESGVFVVERASEMADVEAFDYLRRWVLPGEQHLGFRVTTDYQTQSQPQGSQADTETKIVSPAKMLIQLAGKLGRIDALRQQVLAIPVADERAVCDQLALQTLLAIESGTEGPARESMDRLLHAVVTDRSLFDQAHPGVLLCMEASLNAEEIQEIAEEAAPALTQLYLKEYARPAWLRHLWAIRAELESRNLEPEPNQSPAQWHRVSRSSAFERGGAFPRPRWHFREGGVRSLSSYSDDFLFFASPLQGNFEVEAEVTGFGYRESHLMLGGIWHGLVYDHKQYMYGNVRGELKRVPLAAPMTDTHRHGFIHTRLTQRDGVSSVSFNGRPIVERAMSEPADPWLAIRSMYRVQGGVDDLRISGTPSVPDSIFMVETGALLSWYDYYQPPGDTSKRMGSWQGKAYRTNAGFVSELIHPRDEELAQGCNQESLLVYTRPILEDGVVEYEFWYSPDKSIAHPAIGRECFLLSRDGVQVHDLTDGRYERTSLRPDNFAAKDNTRSGSSPQAVGGGEAMIPLREEEWNSMRVQIEGDELTLVLNGETVFQRELSSKHLERTLGLFHFADQTALWVRNPKWTGSWSKEVPSLNEQVLASPDATFLAQAAEDYESVFTHELGIESLLHGKVTLSEGNPNDVEVTDEGIVLSRNGKDGYSGTTLSPMLRVSGDFDATVTFDQFECTTAKGKIGSVRISVDANNETQDTALIQRLNDREGAQTVQCLKMEKIKGAERRHYFGGQPLDGTAGRLRISRRGEIVYYLLAENDSTEFRLLGQQGFSSEDLKDSGIRFGVQIQGQQGLTRVRFRKIDIRAEGISGQALQDQDKFVAQLDAERKELAVGFQHDFSVKPPSSDLFYTWADVNLWKENAGGFLIDAPGADEWASSGMSLRKQYAGDFDIKFSFQPVKMLVPQPGKHTQVYLQLGLNDSQRTQFSAMLTKTETNALVTQAQVRTPSSNGYRYEILGTVALEDPDYLRAARRGDELYILAGHDSDDRVYLIGSTKIGTEPIAYYGVRMMLHTGHVTGNSQMIARSLDVKAESEIALNAVPIPVNPVRDNTNPALDKQQPSLPSRIYQSIQDLFQ